jgi:hypothetical protein
MDEFFFTWVLLPLLVFFARIADVSLGTIRIILSTKGELHPCFGQVVKPILVVKAMKEVQDFEEKKV